MTVNEAIDAIKCNWPPENYSMLREALNLSIDALKMMDRIHSIGVAAEKNANMRDELDAANDFYEIMDNIKEWEDIISN